MMNNSHNINATAAKQFGSNAVDKGFTIVETLIAIVLFAITLSGGMAIYLNANRIVALATHKRMAVEMANTTMEEFRAKGYTDFDGDFTLADPNVAQEFDYPSSDPANPLKVGEILVTRTVTVANHPLGASPDYKEVTVNVAWPEADQTSQKEIEIMSIIAP